MLRITLTGSERVGADQLGDRIHVVTIAAIQHGNGLPERQGRDELQHAVRVRVRSDCEKNAWVIRHLEKGHRESER